MQMSYFELVRVGRYNVAVLGITNLGALKTRICRVPGELSDSDLENLKVTINQYPTREMIDIPVYEMLIVELYSK